MISSNIFKKSCGIVTLLFAITLFTGIFSGCNVTRYLTDDRDMTDFEYTTASIGGVDKLGRFTTAGSVEKENRDVGLFYFLWLGAHSGGQKNIYDVEDLLLNSPDDLYSVSSEKSPVGSYHFWGQPLYGYYHSADPWVLTRHVEMFMAAGIDFLMFDTTNGPTYSNVVREMLKVLDKFQKQGFSVPKVAFMTNSGPYQTVVNIYNEFYSEKSEHRYPDLWYSPNGKPFITTNLMYFDETKPGDRFYMDFFDMRGTQWPDELRQDEEKFPWMSWIYPQTNHNGVMSVSVAQHTAGKMSLTDSNWGRGFSRTTYLNEPSGVDSGLNYASQWDTVFGSETEVTTAFITGWNEWIAIKFKEGASGVYFVDLFNKEYSRDLELMKGGYEDNFYLQTVQNVKKFKYESAKPYSLDQYTIGENALGDTQWDNVRSFKDFAGDAMERDFRGYNGALHYTDDTNRNDITDTKVTHDKNYLYVLVTTLEPLTKYTDGDASYMNVWLSTKKDGAYDYVVNNTYGKISSVNSDGTYSVKGDVNVIADGNKIFYRIPLSVLGVSSKEPALRIRVSDNVDASDRMNFYIQGDSAPIGELGYTYGYFK